MPVYFIQEQGDGGAIKIGCTAGDPRARLATLQTGNSRRLHLLASIPGGAAEEAALHERFAAYRVSGEWFRVDPYLLGFIEGLSYVHPQAPAAEEPDEDPFLLRYGLTEEQFEAVSLYVEMRHLHSQAFRLLAQIGGPASQELTDDRYAAVVETFDSLRGYICFAIDTDSNDLFDEDGALDALLVRLDAALRRHDQARAERLAAAGTPPPDPDPQVH